MACGKELAGRRVLVVEDEFLIAQAIEMALVEQGCVVVGPVGSIAQALGQIETTAPDAAILNAQLADGHATPVAEALIAEDVPFVAGDGLPRRR